jgi:RimJ/RimL family protein N-acetyltransferase
MTSAAIDPLVDDDAILRMLALSDLPSTLAWRNHDESRRWFHSTDTISEDQHRAWFDRYLARDDDYVFVVDVAGVPVAQTAVYDIAGGSAEFGRLLVDPNRRGRGLSHRAITLSLRAADELLGLDHLYLEVKPDNTRAIRGYRAAGFAVDRAREGAGGALVMVRTRP